jgi:hypothetical protein
VDTAFGGHLLNWKRMAHFLLRRVAFVNFLKRIFIAPQMSICKSVKHQAIGQLESGLWWPTAPAAQSVHDFLHCSRSNLKISFREKWRAPEC